MASNLAHDPPDERLRETPEREPSVPAVASLLFVKLMAALALP